MGILGLVRLMGLVTAAVFRVVLRKDDNWDALPLAPNWGPEIHPRDVLNMSEIVECENGQFGSFDAHTDR